MITPRFEVRQDDNFIYVDIRAPYIKASMIQFEVSEEVFVFTLPPYYLRLRLPGHVIEDDRMTSSYDLASSTVRCKVAKLNPGEDFVDLDMLSKLLVTKRQKETGISMTKPTIQEMDLTPEQLVDDMKNSEFDWEIHQEMPTDEQESVKYGFNNQYSERIGLSMHTGNEINELADPEHENTDARIRLMRETTAEQFDSSHYLADYYDDEMIKELIAFSYSPKLELTEDSRDRVVKLGHRNFLLTSQKSIYIGLIPLVFGWAYDFRANLGDSSVESSWTVGKLAPSMCFLYNSYYTVADVVRDCTARSLVRPLYRNWDLSKQVWIDTIEILRGNKQVVLCVLAKLLQIFESDLHFVYRQILIEDYTIWVQYASSSIIEVMTSELEKAVRELRKDTIYLPILKAEQQGLETEVDSDDDDDNADNALPAMG